MVNKGETAAPLVSWRKAPVMLKFVIRAGQLKPQPVTMAGKFK